MTNHNQDIDDYHSLILNGIPLLDVRASIEFLLGHLPTSANYPILSDDERVAVGICYKVTGRDEAVALGHQLVSGENQENKIKAWQKFYRENSNAVVYCARGGMRSKLTQSWLKDLGIDLPRVHLGYKGLRNYLLSAMNAVNDHPILVVSGDTGTGKTELLQGFSAKIDLEGLANHHGSAFGKNITQQPAQATFENALAVDYIQKQQSPIWFVEDESRNIGKIYLPESLYEKMCQSPLVVVEEALEKRLYRISQLYFVEMSQKYRDVYGEEGWIQYSEYLQKGLSALQKRLGLTRYTVLQRYLDKALQDQIKTNNIEMHFLWLSPLLTEYYDPMYQYQLNKKKDRVIFRGDYQSVRDFMLSYAV